MEAHEFLFVLIELLDLLWGHGVSVHLKVVQGPKRHSAFSCVSLFFLAAAVAPAAAAAAAAAGFACVCVLMNAFIGSTVCVAYDG